MSESVQELNQLSGLLAEPCEDSLAAIEELAPQLPWLSAQAIEQLKNTPLEHWQAEHTRLFISGHPKTECVPFESVWTEGQMMGEAATRIHQFYQAAGFTPDTALPEDFLGTELQFLAFLIQHHREQEEALHEMLELLSTWVPKFATSVRIHAELQLYKDWAKRLEALFSA